MSMLPPLLCPGDEIRVVAPCRSLPTVRDEVVGRALERLGGLGLQVSLGAHVREVTHHASARVDARLRDLHEAFADPRVKGLLTAIGGFNSNQLLPGLDYALVARNPKVLCGRSDATALLCAIHARTGLVTYYGPHFADFGMLHGVGYIVDSFCAQVFSRAPVSVTHAEEWSDDRWFEDQHHRTYLPNRGPVVVQPGAAEGVALGGHLGTFTLLAGTPYCPSLDGAVLFFESLASDKARGPEELDRQLEQVMQQPSFAGVRGLVFGRAPRADGLPAEAVAAIVRSKPRLAHLPVVVDADFGHTVPMFTIPIGGRVVLEAAAQVSITFHGAPPGQEAST